MWLEINRKILTLEPQEVMEMERLGKGKLMSLYENKVEWRGVHLGYAWCQNGVEMEFSAPP